MKSPYIKTKLSRVIDVTEIVTIHYFEFDDKFVFAGESHDFWELVYVDSGRVEIMRGEEKLVLNQGEILFHKPNVFHTIRSYNSSPDIFVISFVCKSSAMTHFEGFKTKLNSSLRPFISSILREAGNTYAIPKNDVNMKKLIKRDNAPVGGEQLIKAYLEQLLISLLRELVYKEDFTLFPSKESMQSHLITSVKQFIEEKLCQKITLDDICSAVGYGKTYVCRLFKEQCKTSVMNYVNMRKIEYAKKLIRTDTYNFSQISDMLCFDNAQYFSRVFSRITGLSPTAYKNTLSIRS